MRQSDAIPRNFRELIAFFRAAWTRTYEDRCLQVAGDLTFTTILSIVPLAAVTLALLTAFPVFSQWTGKVDELMVRSLLPEAVGEAVGAYLAQFAAKAAQLTALGLALLVVTSLMLMLTIEHAFNQIFRVSRERPVVQRLLIYWAVLTLAPILIGASLSMTSYLVSTSLGLVQGLPIAGEALLRGAPVLLTCVALTLLYLVVPNRHVRVRHALIGGFIAGILFDLMKRGLALYLAHFPTYTLIYGAFAVAPIFLLWLYFSWVTVMLGASITALLPGYRFSDPRRTAPGRRFFSALEVLAELATAQRTGGAPPLRDSRSRWASRPNPASGCSSAWPRRAGSRAWAASAGCSRATPASSRSARCIASSSSIPTRSRMCPSTSALSASSRGTGRCSRARSSYRSAS